MKKQTDSLENFIMSIREVWGPLEPKFINKAQALLTQLANTSDSEPWLANLKDNAEASTELYRDPEHGFILLAHIEKEGLYRFPHDHGVGWVIYAVQSGEMEMSTYVKIESEIGPKIIQRESYRVHSGQSRVYLPGDIHDTKCLTSSVLMFRFTSCDLKKEIQAGRMNRYVVKS